MKKHNGGCYALKPVVDNSNTYKLAKALKPRTFEKVNIIESFNEIDFEDLENLPEYIFLEDETLTLHALVVNTKIFYDIWMIEKLFQKQFKTWYVPPNEFRSTYERNGSVPEFRLPEIKDAVDGWLHIYHDSKDFSGDLDRFEILGGAVKLVYKSHKH